MLSKVPMESISLKKIHLLPTFPILICGIVISLLSTSCVTPNHSGKLVVTIPPLKYIVETITCGDFEVEVMVPEGASPETYSPTSSQMIGIEKADIVFTTGLIDFEKALIDRFKANNINSITDLSRGIVLIEGECGHEGHSHHHRHGIDPHTWTSPEQLRIMARNACDAIMDRYPDSLKYVRAHEELQTYLSEVSDSVRKTISASKIKEFLIYHPALTYYARDYGIRQVSLEIEGKEPSAIHMSNLINDAKGQEAKVILYQRQFSRSVVESLATDTGAAPVEINPLSENIIDEILYITKIITG